MTLCLVSSFTVAIAYGGSEGNSPGTAHVASAIPAITSPELWNLAEDTNENGQPITVSTEYHLNFTIADANTLADLDNVTIRFWLDGTATENDTDAEANHYSYTWVEATDTWASLTGAGYIVQDNCEDPGTAGSVTTYEFRLGFKVSRVALYATASNWKVSIFVWDDSDNGDADQTLGCGIAFYAEIGMTDSTHEWTGLTPGVSINETVDGDGDIDFTVLANANWNATTKASGDLTKAPDTIPLLDNLYFNKTGVAVNMETGYLDIPGLTNQNPPTAEASPTATNEVLYLCVPGGTPSGDYTYTLYINIIKA